MATFIVLVIVGAPLIYTFKPVATVTFVKDRPIVDSCSKKLSVPLLNSVKSEVPVEEPAADEPADEPEV